ncbi:unnamed protein product (macronuclear) [Paramecium tetraurelia]|uniref:Uncharacterized protein n=1 Tax=Paramecium tetraurelia TaxID=5888 RepID=A0BH53_PARTE|nr:uncharacterized protein GSPATT00028905001 [Paramecium tetraurelia]CAK57870.1 unnamed protein product [Paramecium tetraurelia]|eukprot:XP_001425268.1 hypothetical protein (macronuclear) [Paramecium tetraurelia strain d4-2]
MQPIIIIDSNSVYDCRTHSLIKSCKFDINVILGSFSKTIPKDQWQTKIKTISLLLLTRFPQEIPKIFQILEVQGSKTDFIKEVYSQEEIQNILQQILENNEKRQLPQNDQKVQNDSTEFERRFIKNNIQTQNIPQLSEDLQRNIPLTIGISISNLVENLKGFCIKYPWWNQFYKRVSQTNNETDAENVLFEIAPLLVQRLHDLKNQSQFQNQDNSINQQNRQMEFSKCQMEQICQRLLELINCNDLDVEFTDLNILEAADEQFLEFLSILFQVLKQMMKINATIEINDNEATFSLTGVIKRFHNYSQNQLLAQSHMFAIQLLENIRRQTQINQSTFEIVASILKQLMPDDNEPLMRMLADRIEFNKQLRDKRKMAKDMKQQVQQQQMNYSGINSNYNKKQKNNPSKQKQLDDYLKLEIARNQQKEEYFPKKKVKKVTKTITVDTSDESYQSSFSFKGEEKPQQEQKPTYFPKLGQSYQYPSVMYPYYNPYCWQYPYQQPVQHQNQFNEQQLSQIFNMGLEAYNDRILRD